MEKSLKLHFPVLNSTSFLQTWTNSTILYELRSRRWELEWIIQDPEETGYRPELLKTLNIQFHYGFNILMRPKTSLFFRIQKQTGQRYGRFAWNTRLVFQICFGRGGTSTLGLVCIFSTQHNQKANTFSLFFTERVHFRVLGKRLLKPQLRTRGNITLQYAPHLMWQKLT